MLVGRPVVLGPEDNLAVRGPEPRAGDRDVAADLEGMLHRGPVRAGHVVVEVDDDRHADADGLTGVGGNAGDLEGASRFLGGEVRDLGRRRALAVPGDGGDGVGGGGLQPPRRRPARVAWSVLPGDGGVAGRHRDLGERASRGRDLHRSVGSDLRRAVRRRHGHDRRRHRFADQLLRDRTHRCHRMRRGHIRDPARQHECGSPRDQPSFVPHCGPRHPQRA